MSAAQKKGFNEETLKKVMTSRHISNRFDLIFFLTKFYILIFRVSLCLQRSLTGGGRESSKWLKLLRAKRRGGLIGLFFLCMTI